MLKRLFYVERKDFTLFGMVGIVLSFFGSIFNVLAYSSVQPVWIGLFFFLCSIALLNLPGIGGVYERGAFKLVFAVGWFWSGLAAIFDNYIGDPLHPGFSDAAYFFETSTSPLFDPLCFVDTVKTIGQNGGAVAIWIQFYKLFALVGLDKGRYIGVAVNVTCVALTALVGVKIVKTIFGDDAVRLRRFVLIYAWCGLLWLFASSHIRDALVLLAVSLLLLIWVRYLESQSLGKFFQVAAASVLSFLIFGMLRTEFVFVPIAMLAAAFAALACAKKSRSVRLKLIVSSVVMLIVAGVALSVVGPDLVKAVLFGTERYGKLSMQESGSDSLGAVLLDQPVPIKVLFGSAFLFVNPVPIWSGFQLDSSYHIFKSFNTIFMYAIVPLFVLALWRALKRPSATRASTLFLAFVVLGFILSIGGTSIEVRHFGAFLVALLVLCLYPDITQPEERGAYHRLVTLYVGAIATVHVAWLLLKMRQG